MPRESEYGPSAKILTTGADPSRKRYSQRYSVPATSLCLLMAGTVFAGAQQSLLECSATSADEQAVGECLSITYSEAETALINIEQSWQRLLELEADNKAPPVAQKPEQDSAALLEETSENSKVIAIVNDTAVQTGLATSGDEVFNVDDNYKATQPLAEGQSNLNDRFSFLPALYRSYRDQHCALQAALFGADRVESYNLACLIAHTRDRTRELNSWLAQKRSIDKTGQSFSGFYTKTSNGAAFQSCDRKTNWWVMGGDSVMASIQRRYNDIRDQNFRSSPSDLLYAEISGTLNAAPTQGAGSDYPAVIFVERINVLRPLSNNDCSVANKMQTADGSLASQVGVGTSFESSAATVDDYAAAGFSYGYFNFWLSACSVTESSVCSAESEMEFASDGDWKLRVDRSIEGDWRVQMISTTENQVIEKSLKVQIDGIDVYLGKSIPEPLNLPILSGIDIATGELAREMIIRLREGQLIRFEWQDENNVMSEVKFSLLGITRALEFFDQSK